MNDDEQKEEGLRWRVKIVKKLRKRYDGSGFILITKFRALRVRPNNPEVDEVGGEHDLDEI